MNTAPLLVRARAAQGPTGRILHREVQPPQNLLQRPHPGSAVNPMLSETAGMAAEAFEGTITDLYLPEKG